jgi:hypothetical protein
VSGPRHGFAALALLLALLTLLAGCGGGDDGATTAAATAGGGFDGDRAYEDVARQVDLGPRPTGSEANAENVSLIAKELENAGVEDVTVQRPLRNVVGVIPGDEPGYVVVAAHHDTKDAIDGFVGANDGGSGVAVVLELARSLPNPLPGPSIAIALFDGEEARGTRSFDDDGTRGSEQYLDLAENGADGSPQLDQVQAMVLFDMVGDCDLQVPMEASSDPDLYDLFAAADPDVFSGRTFPVDDDHTPFLERGIPAVDLIDFDYGPGSAPGEYWHTADDTIDHVCADSLDAIGEASLQALPAIGR